MNPAPLTITKSRAGIARLSAMNVLLLVSCSGRVIAEIHETACGDTSSLVDSDCLHLPVDGGAGQDAGTNIQDALGDAAYDSGDVEDASLEIDASLDADSSEDAADGSIGAPDPCPPEGAILCAEDCGGRKGCDPPGECESGLYPIWATPLDNPFPMTVRLPAVPPQKCQGYCGADWQKPPTAVVTVRVESAPGQAVRARVDAPWRVNVAQKSGTNVRCIEDTTSDNCAICWPPCSIGFVTDSTAISPRNAVIEIVDGGGPLGWGCP